MTKKKNTENNDTEVISPESVIDYYAECNKFKENYLRACADYQNLLKRTAKEKENLTKYQDEGLLKALIPFFDDFKRGIDGLQNENDKQGFLLIYDKLFKILSDREITITNPVGEKFDCDKHEAVASIPINNEEDDQTIVEVCSVGYNLKDKIVVYPKIVGLYYKEPANTEGE